MSADERRGLNSGLAFAVCTACGGTGTDPHSVANGRDCWFCFGTGKADQRDPFDILELRIAAAAELPDAPELGTRYLRALEVRALGGADPHAALAKMMRTEAKLIRYTEAYSRKTLEVRTSKSHPIEANHIASPTAGQLRITLAPGKKHGSWDRDLNTDLARLVNHYDVQHIVCLVEDWELQRLAMHGYAEACAERSVLLHRLAIRDGGVPTLAAAHALATMIADLLEQSSNVVVHCKGGLGRAGTVAACVLVVQGATADRAIKHIREVRSPRAIENRTQESFVAEFAKKYGRGE
jgi:ADP-ribosyl-[dinitrogen reductase] hydrolase